MGLQWRRGRGEREGRGSTTPQSIPLILGDWGRLSHMSRATDDTAKGAWRRRRGGVIVRVKRTAALASLHFDEGHLGGRTE